MPSQYNGLAANVSPPATANISGSTNATPIEVTTSAPHGLSSGDFVNVTGHAVNTGANGIRSVTVTGLSTFTIDGSVGTGVGLATGTAQSLAMGATVPIPSDGDDFTGAALGVGNVGIADRSAALGLWTGASKLANRVVLQNVDPGFVTPWANFTGATVNNVPTAMASAHPLILLGLAGGTFNVLSLSIPFQIGGICGGDVIAARLEATDNSNLTSSWVNLWSLYGAIAPPGVTPAFPAAYSRMTTLSPSAYDGTNTYLYFTSSGVYPLSTTPGTLWIMPAFIPLVLRSASSMTCLLSGDATLSIEIWRPTRMPQ